MNLPTTTILNISKFIRYQKLVIKSARDVQTTLFKGKSRRININQNHPIFSDL